EARRQDPGGGADRLGVRQGSGGDQARLRGAGAGNRDRRQAHRETVAARVAPRLERRHRGTGTGNGEGETGHVSHVSRFSYPVSTSYTYRFRTNFACSATSCLTAYICL